MASKFRSDRPPEDNVLDVETGSGNSGIATSKITRRRLKVIRSFKALHKARKLIFEGDEHALQVTRTKINEEYRKNMNVKDENAIQEMLTISKEVEHELKTTVVQARQVEPGKYEVKILEDTVKLDNVPFQEVPEEVLLANKRKATSKCSNNKEKA